jgi:antitoxin component YwqK of YwqJK toxin-antitoxin module
VFGVEKEYYEDGKVKTEITYSATNQVVTKHFDENGKEVR